MDKSTYIHIRKRLDLEHKPYALQLHYAVNALFVGSIYICWSEFESPLKYFAIPLLVGLIFRNFALMHEAVHRTASKNPYINEIVGIFSGSICLLPFEPWKRSHLEHHTWSGNIEKDPVMALAIVFPRFPKTMQKILSLLWNAWFPILAIMQHIVFWSLAAKTFMKNPNSSKVLFSLAAPLVAWGAALTLLPSNFTISVLMPALALYMIAVEVVNFPHHLQLPQYRGDTRLPIWQQYQISRTCIYPYWLSRWVVLNFNYHSEHHMFPDVPWYHLDKLHAEVRSLLGRDYNTDPYLKWIRENRPLSLEKVMEASNLNSTSHDQNRVA